MGIRFRCHHCQRRLNVKDSFAGKRGRCPHCGGRIRVPLGDADYSLPPEQKPESPGEKGTENHQRGSVAPATDDSHQVEYAAESDEHQPDAMQQVVESNSAGEPPSQTEDQQDATNPLSDSAFDLPPDMFQFEPIVPDTENWSEQEVETPTQSDEKLIDLSVETEPPVVTSEPSSSRVQPSVPAVWYVRPSAGGQYGPVNDQTLHRWLNEYRIDAQAWIWRTGWSQWRQAIDVFTEHFVALEQPAVTPSATPAVSPPPSVLEPLPVTGEHVVTVSDGAYTPAQARRVADSPVSTAEAKRVLRLRKRRRNYILLLVVLALLTIALIVALIFVLWWQPTSSAPA